MDVPSISFSRAHAVETAGPVEHLVSSAPVTTHSIPVTITQAPPTVAAPPSQHVVSQPTTTVVHPAPPQTLSTESAPPAMHQQQWPGSPTSGPNGTVSARFDELRNENKALQDELVSLREQKKRGVEAEMRIAELHAQIKQTQHELTRWQDAVRHLQTAVVEQESKQLQAMDGVANQLEQIVDSARETVAPIPAPEPFRLGGDSASVPSAQPLESNFVSFGSPYSKRARTASVVQTQSQGIPGPTVEIHTHATPGNTTEANVGGWQAPR